MLKVKKSKPILICAISLALCAMGSLTAVAVNHIGNDQNQSATVIAANEVCAMDNVQEVEDEGDMMFGTYERKEAELRLLGTIVDGLRALYCTIGPLPDAIRRSKTNLNRFKSVKFQTVTS